MPENQFGMLIDPEGKAVESISAEEHENLRTCLDLLRDSTKMNLLHSILTYISHGKKGHIELLTSLNSEYLQWCNMAKLGYEPVDPWVAGLIATNTKMLTLKENELPTILATVTALRESGWFADWLSTQV